MNQSTSFRTAVKLVSVAAALSAALMANTSFAANVVPSNQVIVASLAAAQAGTSTQPKTRAEVYQELVSAEKSGELARLDQSYNGA
jgi:hypothetical protein